MSTFPATLFSGKRFAVVGLGKNGLPAALALRAMGADVVAWDDKQTDAAVAAGLTVRNLAEGPFGFDALVLSPGIPHILPQPHPVASRAIAAGVPIWSDVELLYQAVRAAGSGARFAGITGTNGKSTTTALTGALCAASGRPTFCGGNLGNMPMIDAVDHPANAPGGLIVVEGGVPEGLRLGVRVADSLAC
jgi:UDP-N-acetylmuramoylalanine--D-glutamate ligase